MDYDMVNRTLCEYARNNYSYFEMSSMLQKDFNITLRNAICKRLKRCGIASRKGPTMHSEIEIKSKIQDALPRMPTTIGYRFMTDYLRREGMHVRRDTVMKIMRETDKEGVDARRRRRIKRKVYMSMGPNHVWHMDGYDKLKPYGFPIHGCIDGFSRRILWLAVAYTNNDPRVVAQNFLTCVKKLKGCPLVVQADPGTENTHIGAIQCTLRHEATDCFQGISSFRVVKSTLNQRIEAWWSTFRRQRSDWWIQFFKDLAAMDLFRKNNDFDLYSIRFCFMPLLQRELDDLVVQWNSHYIAQSRQATCPGGRPDILFQLPNLQGATNCLQYLTQEDADFVDAMAFPVTCRSGSDMFDSFASSIFERHQWGDASNPDDALLQYTTLKQFENMH
ncbi:uncharacterized protein [Argopecten irradians]|uniref:uncharacterized protein isoform X2 n=1 Tax=Argopecten irradians TaxID=31199 RepID=UPI0037201425